MRKPVSRTAGMVSSADADRIAKSDPQCNSYAQTAIRTINEIEATDAEWENLVGKIERAKLAIKKHIAGLNSINGRRVKLAEKYSVARECWMRRRTDLSRALRVERIEEIRAKLNISFKEVIDSHALPASKRMELTQARKQFGLGVYATKEETDGS